MRLTMPDPAIDWLLEKNNPSVRYFTLRYLLDYDEQDGAVRTARRAILQSEPVQKILAAQSPEGYWAKPGGGYSPKYLATDWQILFLAELGADGRSRPVRKGCEYVLAHAAAPRGGFSAYTDARPAGVLHCLNGNLVWALSALGYAYDERVRLAVEWLAGAITGDDFDRYYASGTTGPNFQCVANSKQPCAWGAIKALRALVNLPEEFKTARVRKAIAATVEFLLGRDLATADYPYTRRISGEWFKFGFPLSYTSDILEGALALCEAGLARDPRLGHAVDLIASKRGPDGRWLLRHSLNGKMCTDVENKGEPSKWVTLRALRVLRAAGREPFS